MRMDTQQIMQIAAAGIGMGGARAWMIHRRRKYEALGVEPPPVFGIPGWMLWLVLAALIAVAAYLIAFTG
jgi:hypothetical protein